jgi:hypothetical protein
MYQEVEKVKAELAHFGVLGMHWGVRRREGESWRTAHLRTASKVADRDIKSFPKGPIKTKDGKVVLTRKDVDDILKDLMRERKKIKVNLIKSQYRDDYMKGKNFVQKLSTRILNTDKYYGDMMYEMNRGQYKK